MAQAKRVTTAGNADNFPIGPKTVAKEDGAAPGGASFGTGPADTISKSTRFNSRTASGRYDARGDGVVVLTLADFAGTDSFILTIVEAGGNKTDTIAFVRGTNATAAAIQTELRSVLAGTDLAVVAGTTDEGPFTITWNAAEFYGKRFPKIVAVTGTGCTGTVARSVYGSTRRYLGEAKYEGTTELVPPTIGTITVTASTDEVQYVTPGAGVDGGSIVLQFRHAASGTLAYDAQVSTIQAALDNLFTRVFGSSAVADSPVVTITGTEVTTLDFGDMSTADTLTLSIVGGTTSSALTYDAALTAAQVQAKVDEAAGANKYIVARTSNLVYTVTKQSAGVGGVWSVNATGFTAKATGGYVLGALVTTAWSTSAGQSVWVLTYSRGKLEGRPIRGGVRVLDNAGAGSFTDGGVADTATVTVNTAGVLGSASAAYTEQATVGDSVFAAAVNDATGESYSIQTDASTPVVFSSLPPGVYTMVARTVADIALSAAATKAFTVT